MNITDGLINELKNKNLLILGFGREGKSSLKLLRRLFPDKLIGIADKNTEIAQMLSGDKNLRFHLGEHHLQSIKSYDLVFKSPGVSLKDIDGFDREKITSQTDIFLRYMGRQTIGITGTKGKSTTASLAEHLLRENGKDVVLLGNIGIPAFDKLEVIDKDTVVVFELSAHQLQYIHHAPKVAVLLNIFPEHLDHFSDFDAYKDAKLNIALFQQETDRLVVPVELKDHFKNYKSNISFFNTGEPLDSTGFLLKGKHNLNNIKAAILAVEPFGVSGADALNAAIKFKPLPHRLEYVGQYGGIRFYNDSISTVPQSAVAAIKAVGKVDTLILGGYDRGLDYSELVDFVTDGDKVSTVIFTGPAGRVMYRLFKNRYETNINMFLAEDVKEAFSIIKKHTPKGGVCLLSPAAASYDKYHNFEHRGDVFKSLAREM